MRGRRLLPVLISTAILLAALNVALGIWSQRVPYKTKLETIRKAENPNIVFTGNSMMDRHLDMAEFTAVAAQHGKDYRPVDAALGASLNPEQWLLFDYAVHQHAGIHTLIAGFNDALLTSEPVTHPMELKGNRLLALDHRFAIEQGLAAYNFDLVEQLEFRVLRVCPLVRERANVWKYVELMRRGMGEMGMPEEKTTELGRVKDFESIEYFIAENFPIEVVEFNTHPDKFNMSYERIFNEAQARNMKVVILLMPISEQHREKYYSQPIWHEYMENMRRLAVARGMTVIDGSEWVNGEKNFQDPLHMTPAGVEIFTKRLAEELSK